MARYAIDTNVYIDALRETRSRDWLDRFHVSNTPFLHLSSVVAHELRAGARDASARTSIDRDLLTPYERRRRVFTPSYAAWKEAAAVLAELAGGSWRGVGRSIVNDALLAMSCRESGVVLVTHNVRDFTRIAEIQPFDFVEPVGA